MNIEIMGGVSPFYLFDLPLHDTCTCCLPSGILSAILLTPPPLFYLSVSLSLSHPLCICLCMSVGEFFFIMLLVRNTIWLIRLFR